MLAKLRPEKIGLPKPSFSYGGICALELFLRDRRGQLLANMNILKGS